MTKAESIISATLAIAVFGWQATLLICGLLQFCK
jgi:hypothetical protein